MKEITLRSLALGPLDLPEGNKTDRDQSSRTLLHCRMPRWGAAVKSGWKTTHGFYALKQKYPLLSKK